MRDAVEDWLVEHFTFLGIPLQNWMVVAFATILIAVLITRSQKQ
jgi:hypothetical protein